MDENNSIQLFEDRKIRTAWDEEQEEWYFSVVDVIAVLTDSSNPTDYLKKMRKRDEQLASYLGTNCPQVAMMGATGKKRKVQRLNSFYALFSQFRHLKLNRSNSGLPRLVVNALKKRSTRNRQSTVHWKPIRKKAMIQTGFISGSFPSVSVTSLPLNGRSVACSKEKSMPFSPMRLRKHGPA